MNEIFSLSNMRRYGFLTLSMLFLAIGLTLMTQLDLGTIAVAALPLSFALMANVPLGFFITIALLLMLALQVIFVTKEISANTYIQIGETIFLGLFIHLATLTMGPVAPTGIYSRWVFFIGACLLIGLATAIESVIDVCLLPSESIVLYLSRKIRKSFYSVRISFEVTLIILALLFDSITLGHFSSIGWGTFAAMFIVPYFARILSIRMSFLEDGFRYDFDPAQTHRAKSVTRFDKNSYTVVITREFGSRGHKFAKSLSAELDIPLFDNKITELTAQEMGVTARYIDSHEEQMIPNFLYDLRYHRYYLKEAQAPEDEIFRLQSEIIHNLASRGSSIISGHGSSSLLREDPRTFHIFIRANVRWRANQIVSEYGYAPEKALAQVRMKDRASRYYHMRYTGEDLEKAENYDLVIDSAKMSERSAVELASDQIRKFVARGGREFDSETGKPVFD